MKSRDLQVFGWGAAPKDPRGEKRDSLYAAKKVYQGHASLNARAMRLRLIHQINANAETTKVLKTFVVSASKYYL